MLPLFRIVGNRNDIYLEGALPMCLEGLLHPVPDRRADPAVGGQDAPADLNKLQDETLKKLTLLPLSATLRGYYPDTHASHSHAHTPTHTGGARSGTASLSRCAT
jgi:hypothetical protein